MSGIMKLPNSPEQINQLLLSLFREMDREALPVEGDYPTGLWWYVGHLDRDRESRKVYNTEVAWSRRLTEMLNHRGIGAEAECRYPNESKQRCDTVAEFGMQKPWWIEVKGSWRAVFDSGRPNKAYLKHLDAAAKDFDKLSSLPVTVAAGVAMVLVGFDQSVLPITEEQLAIVRAKATTDWVEVSDHWDVSGRVSFQTHCWVWSRWNK
jgi:hypothetical protein